MTPLDQQFIMALVGALLGAASAFVSVRFKIKEIEEAFRRKLGELDHAFGLKVQELKEQVKIQYQIEAEKRETDLRIKYINPLRNAVIELQERMTKIQEKIGISDEAAQMRDWFNQIKNDADFRHSRDFLLWCNGVGTFPMNTLHITARFLAYSSLARLETPFRELNRGFNDKLNVALFEVRAAFNDNGYGIYEQLQDSIALFMYDGVSVKTYSQFCRSIADDNDYPWYLRLIDYYRDVSQKTNNIQQIRRVLDNLHEVLDSASVPRLPQVGESLPALIERSDDPAQGAVPVPQRTPSSAR